jgi:hypothetical protein
VDLGGVEETLLALSASFFGEAAAASNGCPSPLLPVVSTNSTSASAIKSGLTAAMGQFATQETIEGASLQTPL